MEKAGRGRAAVIRMSGLILADTRPLPGPAAEIANCADLIPGPARTTPPRLALPRGHPNSRIH